MANSQIDPLLVEVETQLAALEAACAGAERSLMNNAWEEIDGLIMDQRRLTHALQVAMETAKEARSLEFDERVMIRLRYVGLTRDRHIARMRQFRDEIATRIDTLNGWRRAARRWLTGYQPKNSTVGLDQFR